MELRAAGMRDRECVSLIAAVSLVAALAASQLRCRAGTDDADKLAIHRAVQASHPRK